MAPVHLYLAAWIVGGVLLGAAMLLDARDSEGAEDERPGPDTNASTGQLAQLPQAALVSSPAHGRGRDLMLRSARVCPLGLIGFGLSGLLAKGLELDLWPWTLLVALSIGALLIALGYRLSRTRAATANKSA